MTSKDHRRLFRTRPATILHFRSAWTIWFPVSVMAIGLSGCQPQGESNRDPDSTTAQVAKAEFSSEPARPSSLLSGLDLVDDSTKLSDELVSGMRFSDVHEELGLQYVFDNGASPRKLMPESTSGGCGWLDYDADGWFDLFFAQGGDSGAETWVGQPVDELYRNRMGRLFVPVTRQAMLVDVGYGHGVAVADFDDDGFDDVYVTNVGPDALYPTWETARSRT